MTEVPTSTAPGGELPAAATPPANRGRRPKEVWASDRGSWWALWRLRGRVAAESVGFVFRGWPTTVVVWLMIGIALALPSALYLVELNLARAAGQWQGQPGFSVYFEPGRDNAAPALAARLRNDPGIGDVRLIAPDEALAELGGRPGFAEAVDAVAGIESNLLPTTVRASVVPGIAAGRLVEVAESAGVTPGVDAVIIEKTWLERLAAIRDVARQVTLVMTVLLGVGAVLISSAAVRLAIAGRLAEREVLALVGADARTIRRPFLYLGVLYGLGGAVVAAALLAAALIAVEAPLGRLADSYGTDLNLQGFDPMFLAVLVGAGALLGAVGSRVAAWQTA